MVIGMMRLVLAYVRVCVGVCYVQKGRGKLCYEGFVSDEEKLNMLNLFNQFMVEQMVTWFLFGYVWAPKGW